MGKREDLGAAAGRQGSVVEQQGRPRGWQIQEGCELGSTRLEMQIDRDDEGAKVESKSTGVNELHGSVLGWILEADIAASAAYGARRA